MQQNRLLRPILTPDNISGALAEKAPINHSAMVRTGAPNFFRSCLNLLKSRKPGSAGVRILRIHHSATERTKHFKQIDSYYTNLNSNDLCVIFKLLKSINMPNPITLKMKHAEITLEPGSFAWCACGKTSSLPFCDGAHTGTKFKQVSFKIPEKREKWLCQSK